MSTVTLLYHLNNDLFSNMLYMSLILIIQSLTVAQGLMLVLKLSGQFGPSVLKFYWPKGTVVSFCYILFITDYTNVSKFFVCIYEDFYTLWNSCFVK